MNPIDALKEQQARDLAALTMRQERETSLAAIKFPKRKTGEMNLTFKTASAISKQLEVYDAVAQPPAYADLLRQVFNESVARLNELVTAKDKK